MVAQCFQTTNRRIMRGIIHQPATQLRIWWLSGINNQIAINQHRLSRINCDLDVVHAAKQLDQQFLQKDLTPPPAPMLALNLRA
jgi:hypothetical protein